MIINWSLAIFRKREAQIATGILFSPIITSTIVMVLPLLTSAVICAYLLTWAIYLRYAQTDNPKKLGGLPYLPLSLKRVYKVTVAVLGAITFLGTHAVPIFLRWIITKCLTRRSDLRNKIFENIYYGSARSDKRLDVYSAGNFSGEQLSKTVDHPKKTVIIFIYGGAWNSGVKEMYKPMAATLQEKGYVVVVPTYSTYPTGYLAEMVSDIRAVIMWTKEHVRNYGGDPTNVYLMGHSAGAHLAAYTVIHDALGTHVKFTKNHLLELPVPAYSTPLPRIQGLILLAGVFDIVDHYDFESRRGVEEVSAMARVMGNKLKLFRGSSPTCLLEACASKLVINDKPLGSIPSHFLIIHGVKDHTVPISSSQKFAQYLTKAGAEHISLHLLENVDHSQPVTDLMLSSTQYARTFFDLLKRFIADQRKNDYNVGRVPFE